MPLRELARPPADAQAPRYAASEIDAAVAAAQAALHNLDLPAIARKAMEY